MKIILILVLLTLSCAFNIKAAADTNIVFLTPLMKLFLCSEKDFHPQTVFQSDEVIIRTLAVEPDSTNRVYYRALPYSEAYDFKLIDTNGQQVPKTTKGLENSKDPKPPKNKDERYSFKPVGIGYEPHQFFRPDEMFVISNPGVYKLSVRMRICVPMTNGVIDTASMLDLKKLFDVKDFGMVVSEPLTVRIIKK